MVVNGTGTAASPKGAAGAMTQTNEDSLSVPLTLSRLYAYTCHCIGPVSKYPPATVYSLMSSVVSRMVCHARALSDGVFHSRTVLVGAVPSEFWMTHRNVIGFVPSSAVPVGETHVAIAVLAAVEKLNCSVSVVEPPVSVAEMYHSISEATGNVFAANVMLFVFPEIWTSVHVVAPEMRQKKLACA